MNVSFFSLLEEVMYFLYFYIILAVVNGEKIHVKWKLIFSFSIPILAILRVEYGIISDLATVGLLYLIVGHLVNNKKKLVASLCISMTLVCYIVLFISTFMIMWFGEESEITFFEYMITLILETISTITVVIILKKIKFKKMISELKSTASIVAIIFLFVTTYGALFLVHYYEAFNQLIRFTVMFLIIEIIFVLFFIIKDREKISKKIENRAMQHQIETLQEYTDLLEKEQMKLRKFKHDYLNLIVSFRTSLEYTDAHALQMINQFEIYSEKQLASVIWIFKDLRQIKVRNLKSLIISKMFKSQNEGIKVDFECREPIKKIHMDEFDYLRVIGNLLDNAIEATKLCEKKEIGICLFIKEKQFTVVLTNTYKEELKLTNITHSGYTTKENHLGLGLTNIEEIKKKNSNLFVQYQAINQIFTVKVSLELSS